MPTFGDLKMQADWDPKVMILIFNQRCKQTLRVDFVALIMNLTSIVFLAHQVFIIVLKYIL